MEEFFPSIDNIYVPQRIFYYPPECVLLELDHLLVIYNF